jgi:hypothetical protein
MLMPGLENNSSLYLLCCQDKLSYPIKGVIFRDVTPYSPLEGGWMKMEAAGSSEMLVTTGLHGVTSQNAARISDFVYLSGMRKESRWERSEEDSTWLDSRPAHAAGAQHLLHAPLQMATDLINAMFSLGNSYTTEFITFPTEEGCVTSHNTARLFIHWEVMPLSHKVGQPEMSDAATYFGLIYSIVLTWAADYNHGKSSSCRFIRLRSK